MKYARGKHPNCRNGFKQGNSKGKYYKTPETIEDDRRLWLFSFAYKRRAKRKNLECTLSKQEFLDLVKSSCYYCGLSYIKETRVVNKKLVAMLTIDRKNSSLGYTNTNCVPACKQCNTIKMNYSYDAFISKIKQIYLNLRLNS